MNKRTTTHHTDASLTELFHSCSLGGLPRFLVLVIGYSSVGGSQDDWYGLGLLVPFMRMDGKALLMKERTKGLEGT
jgi:hypothetical protein